MSGNIQRAHMIAAAYRGTLCKFQDLSDAVRNVASWSDNEKRALRVMAQYAATIRQVEVSTIEVADIFTEGLEQAVYSYSKSLTWPLQFISGARTAAKKLGRQDLFRSLRQPVDVHPWMSEWFEVANLTPEVKYHIARDCAHFFRWLVSRLEFREHTCTEVPLVRLQRRHLLSYQAHLSTLVAQKKLKGTTAKHYLQRLIRFLRGLHTMGRLTRLEVDRITIRDSPSRERIVPSDHDIQTLLTYLSLEQNLRPYLVYITLLLSTGARPGEILKLTPRHVNVHDRTIWLQSKGGSGRWVPVEDCVWALLLDYCAGIKIVCPDEPIMRTPKGMPMTSEHVKSVLRKARDKGIWIDGCVSIRHRFATDGLEAGVPWSTMCDILGHKSPAQLMRYQHATQELRRQEVDRAFEGGYLK